MKKITLFAIALLAIITSSCSNIAEDERLIEMKPEIGDRAVLVEDFTGQECVNCPNGTDAIHKIQEAYGEDKVIAVAIHSGPFGVNRPTKKYSIALKNDFTQQYWDAVFDDQTPQPMARFNRSEQSGDYQGEWAKIVSSQLSQPAAVDIKLDCSYDAATRTITLKSELKSASMNNAKYQLWLIEDGIVTGQSQPDGSVDTEYIHNHILRAALNGDWGEDVNLTSGYADLTNTYTIPEDYVADNCSIVAFTYTEAGVLQATKVKINN